MTLNFHEILIINHTYCVWISAWSFVAFSNHIGLSFSHIRTCTHAYIGILFLKVIFECFAKYLTRFHRNLKKKKKIHQTKPSSMRKQNEKNVGSPTLGKWVINVRMLFNVNKFMMNWKDPVVIRWCVCGCVSARTSVRETQASGIVEVEPSSRLIGRPSVRYPSLDARLINVFLSATRQFRVIAS